MMFAFWSAWLSAPLSRLSMADAVRPIIAGNFGEEHFTFRRVSGTGHAAGRVGDDLSARRDEAGADERRNREKDRGRIAARIRDDRRGIDSRAVELGHAVRN